MIHKKTITFIALPLIYILSSCVSIGNTEAPPAFLVLTPENNIKADSVNTIQASNATIVLIPDVPRKLDTNRIPVQVSDSSIAYIQGAFWADKPARLMQGLIAETITATTGQLVLDGTQTGGLAKKKISGTLSEFGINEQGSYAIVRYDAVKVNRDNIIEKRRFEAQRNISTIDAIAAGEALNEAANEVATNIAKWSD